MKVAALHALAGAGAAVGDRNRHRDGNSQRQTAPGPALKSKVPNISQYYSHAHAYISSRADIDAYFTLISLLMQRR